MQVKYEICKFLNFWLERKVEKLDGYSEANERRTKELFERVL